jgi:hypothetical protein
MSALERADRDAASSDYAAQLIARSLQPRSGRDQGSPLSSAPWEPTTFRLRSASVSI